MTGGPVFTEKEIRKLIERIVYLRKQYANSGLIQAEVACGACAAMLNEMLEEHGL